MADCKPIAVVINKQPQKIAVAINKQPQKIAVVTQILRGPRGATDVTAIAPLQLTGNDELKITPFKFVQTTNLAIWTIQHNLNEEYPWVRIIDDFGETIIGDILTIDNNNLQITFNQPTTGIAYLI